MVRWSRSIERVLGQGSSAVPWPSCQISIASTTVGRPPEKQVRYLGDNVPPQGYISSRVRGTAVSVTLLDHMASLPEKLLNEQGDVAASNRDRVDIAANDVPVGNRNDMRDPIAAVDHCPSHRTAFFLRMPKNWSHSLTTSGCISQLLSCSKST